MNAYDAHSEVAWLDFASYQLEFRLAEFAAPAGSSALMLRGQVDLAPGQVKALTEAGFRSFPSKDGRGFRTMWMRQGAAFSVDEGFAGAFPGARRVAWSRSRIVIEVPGRSPFAPAVFAPVSLRSLTRPPVEAPAGVSPPQPPVVAVQEQVLDQSKPPAAPRLPVRGLPRAVPGAIGRQAGAAPPAPAAAPLAEESSPAVVAKPPESPPQPAPPSASPPSQPRRLPGAVPMSEAAKRQFAEAEPLEGGLPDIEFQDDAVQALHSPAQVNRYQARYEPQSKVGKPIAMIPVNMAGAAKAALLRLEEAHGDIDAWVAKRARWTLEELEQLSPEQVDAVALMLEAIDRGAGAILADQTGLGKGRVLAAVARICALEGRTVIFLTEKANLFSDFWRDVRDISSEDVLGTPFILNEKAKVVDTTSADGKVLFSASKKQDIQKVVASGKLPEGCRLLMATYSQFNRKGSPKVEFLGKVAASGGKNTPAVAVRDESHNAAGDSNVSAALGAALAPATVVHSSATFARDGRNMQSYGSILPPSLREADLSALFRVGGMAFAEALSQALVEEGVLIRREHDLSNIRIEVRDDLERIDRNRAYADAVSPILGGLAAVARKVSDLADERNGENAAIVGSLPAAERKSAREKWYTMNFGAVLAALVRQVVTAMKVDQCVGDCVDLLLAGEKPVVVIETTMEALMRDLARGVMSEEDGSAAAPVQDAPPVPGDAVEGDADEESESALQKEGAGPPDYRDALRLSLQRMTELIVKRGQDDPERVPVDDPEVTSARTMLAAMIDALPDLPLSPIDDIRERVEAIGSDLAAKGRIALPWKFDEISARSMRVVGGKYESMPARDRNDVIVAFNGGRLDGVVVTRAGSTGLSLHASERVQDRRRRVMIELQIPSNVVERVQFWGRVNRRGQVVEPGFRTLSTGLPIEARQLAMQNRKVAQLSANVSANAENATSMDVPDVIDKVGNDICKRILTERPAIADRMCIAMRGIDEEQAEEELYYVNKLLQRLVLLPGVEQAALYDEVIENYEDLMREMTAHGRHPSQSRELQGSWTVEKRELFDAGNPADGPVFGRPVWSVSVRGEREAAPLSAATVERMVASASARLEAEYGPPADLGYFAAQVAAIRTRTDRLLADALPKGFTSTAQALNAIKPNAVKVRSQALKALRDLAGKARPGAWISVRDDDGTPVMARIVDVRAPGDDGVHLAGRWTVAYALPGDEKPRELSLSSVMRDQAIDIYAELPKGQTSEIMRKFDAAPRGTVTERRTLLDGNLVAAVRIAAEGRLGSAAVWTDENGVRRRGVLLPRRQSQVTALPGCTFCPDAALEVMNRAERLEASPSKPSAGVMIRFDGGFGGDRQVVIEVPTDPKPVSERIRRVFEAAGAQFEEGQAAIIARAPAADARKLLGAYLDSSRCLYFPGRFRKLALSATKLLPPAKQEAAPAPRM